MKTFLLLLLLATGAAQADVYKCKGPDGGVKFQKNPCAGNPDAPPMEIKQPSPETQKRLSQEALNQRNAEEAWQEEKIAKQKQQDEDARELEHQLRQYEFNQRQQTLQEELDAIDRRIACRKAAHISPHDECWEMKKRGEI